MTGSLLKLVLGLLKNGLRFKYLKWSGKPSRPQALSLEITHHCIAKCIMCNIWKIPKEVPELSIDECLDLLSSELFSDLRELDITGGEPFLRKDLLDLFSGICVLKDTNLKSLRSIAITTNGLLTGPVIESSEKILQKLEDKQMDLIIVCAMDAVGGIHDKIRNVKNAWSRVNQTVEGLIRLRERFANLIIGLKTTILPINVSELEKIAQYADSKDLFTIISPCIITEGRYLNTDQGNGLVFGQADINRIVEFFQSDIFRWSYHADTLVHFFQTGKMNKPCSCGFNYFFVRSTGDLFLCPLINQKAGNLKERSVGELFFSKKASSFRRRVGQYPECRQCTEPGLERYSLPYEGFSYLSMLFKMDKRSFLQLHYHMGLDKFFS